MAITPDAKTSGFDIVRMVVWSGAGLILAWVGINTSDTMTHLASEVGQLRIALVRLESKVERLPPPEMIYRIQALERGIVKCQSHLEENHPDE